MPSRMKMVRAHRCRGYSCGRRKNNMLFLQLAMRLAISCDLALLLFQLFTDRSYILIKDVGSMLMGKFSKILMHSHC